MADVKFLYDTVNIYYNKGIEAREKSNIDLAKRSFLLAAETLLKMAKESKGELQKVRFERANRLIEMSENLEVNLNITQNEKIVSNDNFSQEDIKFSQSKIPNISFNDVAGLEEVKKSINTRIILPMQNKEIYERFKKEIGGGVLLYGPPGTGKTMIAKAIANEVQADFYSIRCSDIVSKWFGEAEQNIKELFETASKSEKAIIFFDEFEALASKRGDQNNNAMNRIVPELLAQIQGFTTNNNNLLLLAATNRPWDIDSAFLRPGRFNEMIYIGLPDYEARLYIIKKNLEELPISNCLDFDEIAKATEGYNGADVKELCERMKDGPILRMIDNPELKNEKITRDDYLQVIKKVKSTVMEDDIKAFKEFDNNR